MISGISPRPASISAAGHESAGAALGNVVAVTDRADGRDREPEGLPATSRKPDRSAARARHAATASTVATPTIRPTALRSVKVASLSVSRCSTRVLIGTVFVARRVMPYAGGGPWIRSALSLYRRARAEFLLIRWAVLAAAFAVTTWLLSGMDVSGGFWAYIWVSALFGIVNAIIGTVLRILTLPLTLLTLGLFSIVVNALMLEITERSPVISRSTISAGPRSGRRSSSRSSP